MIPGVNAGVERTKALWNFPGRQVAYLVAREALLGLQDHVLIGQISFGDSEEAKPVICRIHLRGRASVRCDNRLEIEVLPRFGRDACRIHQAVATHEHLVVHLWQFRQDVASLTVGDHNLGELRRQLHGFGDHPHACFGTVRACNDSLNVIGSAGHRAAVALRRDEPREKKHQNRGERP